MTEDSNFNTNEYPQENANMQEDEIQDEFALAKHSLKRKRIERKIRKKRKKVKELKSFLRFISLILVVFLAYHFMKLPQWYLPKDTFSDQTGKNIEIINNDIIPDYVIRQSLKNLYVPKLPIFLIKVKPIKKELFKIPVIKNIYVRRYGCPARIQIIIRERQPIALIKTDLKAKPVAFFTADGILITHKNYMNLGNSKSALKILTNKPQLGKEWTVKKVQEVEKIVKAVETYSNEKVEYIDLRNPNDVYVKIQTTSIRLGQLDSTVFERIKRIYTILPQIEEVDSQIKYIDLSWDKVNYLKLKKTDKNSKPKESEKTE